MTLLRKPADPYADPSIARVLKFMTDHGYHYADRISERQASFDEYQAEAGPTGYLCPVTQELLDGIDRDIWEIAQEACDRYDDWASDPLP